MGTVIENTSRGNAERHQRWDRSERAALCERYGDLHAQGLSQRQAAQELDVPRSTLQAWRAYHERLDERPMVVTFVHRIGGLAFLPRLGVALHLVSTAVGACGIRLGGLFVQRTGRDRCVGASYGTQPQGNRRGAEAIVASRHADHARLARAMPAKAITLTQDETCTGGLCLGGMAPLSNSMLLEHTAQARDHDTGQALMAPALAGLHGHVMQSPSDAAPGLLASVAQHLGAPHAPDLFHVQQALSKAVAAPMAVTQRAAHKAVAQAEAVRKRVSVPLANTHDAPEKRGPGRPRKGATSRAQGEPELEAARQAPQRLTGQREQGPQRLRAMGHASHCVDVERGVRRNGKRIAGDIQRHIDTIRTVAQHERLSETCLERLEQAARVVPTMPATIECVAEYGRQQVRPAVIGA